jgi:hypothetical protein
MSDSQNLPRGHATPRLVMQVDLTLYNQIHPYLYVKHLLARYIPEESPFLQKTPRLKQIMLLRLSGQSRICSPCCILSRCRLSAPIQQTILCHPSRVLHTRRTAAMSGDKAESSKTKKATSRTALDEMAKDGAFKRKDSVYRDFISDDNPRFKPEGTHADIVRWY